MWGRLKRARLGRQCQVRLQVPRREPKFSGMRRLGQLVRRVVGGAFAQPGRVEVKLTRRDFR